MTIETTTAKQFFTADGTTGTFYFTYRLLRAADLQVYITETLIDPGEYSVTINANGVGGNVQFTIPPGTIPDPVRGLIYRHVDYTQETHLPTESDFDQKSVENALDKLTMEVQQLQEEISRAATLSLFDESGASIVLPPPNSRRALLWHPDEDGRLINSTYDPDTLFSSTSALLVTMQGYLASALAAQVAALAAQAAAEAAQADAENAAGTATTASGNYNTYFPSLVGPSTQSPGDMLVWQEVAPSVFGYGTIPAGPENDILQIVAGIPTWAVPPNLDEATVFTMVASFTQAGDGISLNKDYINKVITITADATPPPIEDTYSASFTQTEIPTGSGTYWHDTISSNTFPGGYTVYAADQSLGLGGIQIEMDSNFIALAGYSGSNIFNVTVLPPGTYARGTFANYSIVVNPANSNPGNPLTFTPTIQHS